MDLQKKEVKEFFLDVNEKYTCTPNVYNLIVNGIEKKTTDPDELYLYGTYYLNRKCTRIALNRLKQSISLGNCDAMIELGKYRMGLHSVGSDSYREGINYIEMASKKNSYEAIMILAYHFERYCNDKQKAIEYYLQAMNLGYNEPIVKLGNIYAYYGDYIKSNEYFAMFINKEIDLYLQTKKGDLRSIFNCLELINTYHNIPFINLTNLVKLINSIDMTKYHYNLHVPLSALLFARCYKEKIDLLKLHFNYAPGSAGYEEAEKDFNNRLLDQEKEKLKNDTESNTLDKLNEYCEQEYEEPNETCE